MTELTPENLRSLGLAVGRNRPAGGVRYQPIFPETLYSWAYQLESMERDFTNAGYLAALRDITDLLANATANGSNQHYTHEILDQLIVLAETRGVEFET